tara:strand:- start:1005 stop:1376 length:372 start_codon:yes stop_codon:yes gene_type:complete
MEIESANIIINNNIENDNIENDNIENNNIENDNSEYSVEYLNKIKETIENMDKVHHIEIFKLLNNENNINFNENNNGTFINLTDLKNNTIEKLQNYINYFKKQQSQLINLEDQKKQIENCFFN